MWAAISSEEHYRLLPPESLISSSLKLDRVDTLCVDVRCGTLEKFAKMVGPELFSGGEA